MVTLGFMTTPEHSEYIAKHRQHIVELENPNIMIFLRSNCQTNAERIKRRGRDFEQDTIDLPYLQSLADRYESYIQVVKEHHPEIKLLEIETDTLSSDQVFEVAMKEINKMM
jgi:deoxyadenosine/deoxycytidine kinase